MLLRRLLISMGATASLSIQVAFVEAEWYFKAILEFGKIFLIVGDKWSWNASGTLEIAVDTAIFNSASVLLSSSFDWALWNGNLGCALKALTWSRWPFWLAMHDDILFPYMITLHLFVAHIASKPEVGIPIIISMHSIYSKYILYILMFIYT